MVTQRFHYARLLLALSLVIFGLIFAFPVQARNDQGASEAIQITGVQQPPGFFPALLTVHVNDYITFVNLSSPPETASIAASGGSFSSPPISPGKLWTLTLGNPGEYEYHDTAVPPRMTGVIIVVPEAISLLPTPQPAIAATALALIESGKTPPDSLANVTPTPALNLPTTHAAPAASLAMRASVPAEVGLALLALLAAVIVFVRHRRRKRRPDVQDAAPAPPARPRRQLAWIRWPGSRDGEDDLEDIDDEI